MFQPVKRRGLDAAGGSTPFDVLFLMFSFFIIGSALMLVLLLFRLGIDQRAAEIGILLAQDPKLLLVDEPVAGMTPAEVERTGELLVSLAGEHTVVVVEHDMDFVRSIARKVTVLHQGRVLAEGPMERIQADPAVIEVYLGE